MHKYSLEFTLSMYGDYADAFKKALAPYTDSLEIDPMPRADADRLRHYKIQILTIDPTIIFDMCSEYGRIKAVKIDEQGR
ncbi:MAG TPA: hypothetical protein PKL77_03000 [Candidatus Omnitrophota bacterium]|mgnify:FL=1|nr:hypothetical protein [Candidatus Omnitrophota bacterium]HPT07235.1 hypothetical protein [Candidatus Omnitrophota bacterium]